MPACRECAGRDLAFVAASAAFCYDGPARALVTACKFRALRSLTDDMAGRAAPAFAAALTGAGGDVVVTSVPAHRGHQLDRGFDLAEGFARRLARDAGLTYAPLLRRVRHGARQSGLDRASRAANVHRAFALREENFGVRKKLKRVIIVDDVYTTGETLNQCAEALAQANPDPLAFTFARTVRATHAQASRDHAVPKERCR
jgi:predicted amidophosphoribosyltransferase